ncbi:putative alkaline shock family protein YloU [Salsuginibacillus halophilus]|uniref:Putative alkaline shock family protein YloU n=1 Tax=Salsuginibacillus halophilus TaxID=517424 RepID=A0A2P8HAE8_9BACI|nr:Asp23/Gls24 family envelope stress response protein [Salsuginibacillus halophilus]PSL43195.1 putative alkaline shock family protein YloU [Salsuginibacillus halophilus]
MSENHMFDIEEHKNDLGKVEISPEVIEVIAGIAASEVEGVTSLRGGFATGVAERLGKKNHGKGIKVELGENGVTIDVSVFILYGMSVPEVAKNIQENIEHTLKTMTSVALESINIHVVGIQFETHEEDVQLQES